MSGIRSNSKIGFEERLGSDLVTNGAFVDDTNWAKGNGWTIAAGVANCDGSQLANSYLQQDPVVELAHKYRTVYTATRTAGTITVLAGISGVGTARNSAATFTEDLIAAGDTGLSFRANVDFIGTIDNASVKEINVF